jgi:hypothetical protein
MQRPGVSLILLSNKALFIEKSDYVRLSCGATLLIFALERLLLSHAGLTAITHLLDWQLR